MQLGCKLPDFIRWLRMGSTDNEKETYMGMGQYLLIPFLGE